jgi:hypothetical protein
MRRLQYKTLEIGENINEIKLLLVLQQGEVAGRG